MAATIENLPRHIYPLRVVGMALGGVVGCAVLLERDASVGAWLTIVLSSFVWPHVAYVLAIHSRDPQRAELRNLLVDSAITAAFVPVMHFNLLPSVLVVTLTMMDKIATGFRGLWLRSLPGMVVAGLGAAWLSDPQFAPQSSMRVVIACLPVLVVHTLAVSLSSARLIRTVARQNQQLDELRRIDPMTGLYGRDHWEQEVQAALQRHVTAGEPACLLMLDIDSFKQINDRLGHTVGDDVIRALGQIVRACVRSTDCAGRYGGDEFAVVLVGANPERGQEVAERIRLQVEHHRLRDFDDLRFTVSLGVALAQPHHATAREWIAAADAALYRAKHAGRNRVELDATA